MEQVGTIPGINELRPAQNFLARANSPSTPPVTFGCTCLSDAVRSLYRHATDQMLTQMQMQAQWHVASAPGLSYRALCTVYASRQGAPYSPVSPLVTVSTVASASQGLVLNLGLCPGILWSLTQLYLQSARPHRCALRMACNSCDSGDDSHDCDYHRRSSRYRRYRRRLPGAHRPSPLSMSTLQSVACPLRKSMRGSALATGVRNSEGRLPQTSCRRDSTGQYRADPPGQFTQARRPRRSSTTP